MGEKEKGTGRFPGTSRGSGQVCLPKRPSTC